MLCLCESRTELYISYWAVEIGPQNWYVALPILCFISSEYESGSIQSKRRRARQNRAVHDNDNNENGETQLVDEELGPRSYARPQLRHSGDHDLIGSSNAYNQGDNTFQQRNECFTQVPTPPSLDLRETSETLSRIPVDRIPLSYILHPSHETNITTPTENDVEESSKTFSSATDKTNPLTDVCTALGITMETSRIL